MRCYQEKIKWGEGIDEDRSVILAKVASKGLPWR